MHDARERALRIGCSGWNYKHWRNGVFYPPRLPPRQWLAFYADRFDTVEINNTFYRLPTVSAVQGWVDQSPPDFLFTVKMSRYITHIKRLTDLDEGIRRFYERIDPLVRSPKLGPVLWQLPPTFQRDDERLAAALDALPPGRHCFEFRHESWFVDETFELLDSHGVGHAIGDSAKYPFMKHVVTGDFAFVRFHAGTRGRGGNYSESELREWAERLRVWNERFDVYAYFNNDWEGYAIQNGLRLKELLGVTRRDEAPLLRSTS